MKSIRKNERGVVGIILAIAIVALLLVVALVVDVGQAYVKRSQLQTVVDAAALAAAQDLSQGKSESIALQSAETYANDNTDDSFDSLDITFSDDIDDSDDEADTVRVVAKQSESTFFARIGGIDIFQVAAEAEAKGQLANAVTGVAPMIAPEAAINDHIGPENAMQFPIQGSGFWLVDFSDFNAGASTFAEWIVNGYPEPVTIGDAGIGTGVKASLKAALEERILADPKVVLPVYDVPPEGSGNAPVTVSGFAEFVITDFQLTGENKYFEGYFTDGTVVEGVSVAGGDAPDFGVVVLKLTD